MYSVPNLTLKTVTVSDAKQPLVWPGIWALLEEEGGWGGVCCLVLVGELF